MRTNPAAIKVDVDVVNILCSVRDKKGALIGNLTKDDFTLLEDGKPQTIKYFEKETDLPLTIGLLVDVSGSQARLIEDERHAALQFFSQVLRKKDMAFLISFGPEAELLQDFTNSPRLLESALRDLRVSSGVGGLHPGPVPTASQQRGTVLYDAIYLGATDRLQKEVGRKGDGRDHRRRGRGQPPEERGSHLGGAAGRFHRLFDLLRRSGRLLRNGWIRHGWKRRRACSGRCRRTPAAD